LYDEEVTGIPKTSDGRTNVSVGVCGCVWVCVCTGVLKVCVGRANVYAIVWVCMYMHGYVYMHEYVCACSLVFSPSLSRSFSLFVSLSVSLLLCTLLITTVHTATHCNTLQHTATHCNTQEVACYAAQVLGFGANFDFFFVCRFVSVGLPWCLVLGTL